MQTRLRRCVVYAYQRIESAWDVEFFSKVAGDFCGLVKTAGAQTVRVQRHRYDELGPDLAGCHQTRFNCVSQMFGKEAAQVKVVAIFEIPDQTIDRKVIGPDGIGRVKVWSLPGAIRAGALIRAQGEGALGATGRRQAGEILGAGRTHGCRVAWQLAECTGLRQQHVRRRTNQPRSTPGGEALGEAGLRERWGHGRSGWLRA